MTTGVRYMQSPAEFERESDAALAKQGRVLVVDDSATQRRVLSLYLKRWGYDVVEAETGQQALALFIGDTFDVVISDWMMPEMDGLELCKACRALVDKPYAYFILLTSKTDKDDIARGLDGGADDFVSKPVSSAELLARIRAGERILDMERELRKKNRQVTEAYGRISRLYDALDRELVEARNLQQALIRDRHARFGPSAVSLTLQPSGHIGGDLVGFFTGGPNELGLFSLDVSGHGVASALLTARLAAELSGQTPDRNIALCEDAQGNVVMRPPHETAERLNRMFMKEIKTEQYFTMTLASVRLDTGQVQIVYCGAPGALLQDGSGSISVHFSPGYPIGMIEDATWTSEDFTMQPGSRMLFFSDGITECENHEGRQLETNGLCDLFEGYRDLTGPDLLETLTWDVSDWSKDAFFADDVSALLFEFEA